MVNVKNLTALLVGRNYHLRESVKMYLDSKGFQVLATASFEAALEHLGRQTTDLIIIELGRSAADALTFFAAIKKRLLASEAYKIIVCDSCLPEGGCNGLEQHADFCIPKPLNKESVDQMILRIEGTYEKISRRVP